VTGDPLTQHALELLARGHYLSRRHYLYSGDYVDAGLAEGPEQLRRLAERLVSATVEDRLGAATQANLRAATELHRSAVAEGELAAALADAHADHTLGRYGTRRVLDDARCDSTPAADTALGRQEALRRTAGRVRQQRQYIDRSRHHSHLLAQRLRRLAHPRRRHASQVHHASLAAAVPLIATNIYDPVANICASMNYVIHRYGVCLNGENFAVEMQQADAHRPPKGY
jgi:hypothetical protein